MIFLFFFLLFSGQSGQKVKIEANFFELKSRGDWTLIKYHVDFNPAEDRTFERKRLLRPHSAKFQGAHLFDGSTIFSAFSLCQEVRLFL